MSSARNKPVNQLVGEVHDYQLNVFSREIYLHTNIDLDEDLGVEYSMAIKFVKNLHLLDSQNSNNILIHMHTNGGVWADGMAIFNSIRFSKSPITILAYAQASSMGGVLFQLSLIHI